MHGTWQLHDLICYRLVVVSVYRRGVRRDNPQDKRLRQDLVIADGLVELYGIKSDVRGFGKAHRAVRAQVVMPEAPPAERTPPEVGYFEAGASTPGGPA